MGKVLATNVAVHRPNGETVWYGPAYANEADIPAEDAALIGEHCYVEAEEPTPPEAGEPASAPFERRKKDDLAKLAEANNIDVDAKATKDDIITALRANNVEG